MTKPSVGKKYRLKAMEYDEISLVDAGANQEAHVLLVKRDRKIGKRVLDSGSDSSGRTTSSNSSAPKKNPDEQSNTQRAQNWDDARHPRSPAGSPAGGEFSNTSAASKEKYGRGGTTGADISLEHGLTAAQWKIVNDAAAKKKGGGGGGSKAKPAAKPVLQQKDAPKSSPSGAKMIDFKANTAYYDDGSSFNISGWHNWYKPPKAATSSTSNSSTSSSSTSQTKVPAQPKLVMDSNGNVHWETVGKAEHPMPMDVVEKKKVKYYCGECGEDTAVAKGENCPHSKKHTIKKSIVIVRKETDDATAADNDSAVTEEEYDEEDYEDDLEDSDADDDDEEEEEAADSEVAVGKRALEFLTIAGSCAEQLAKGADYESVMTAFNQSADVWNDHNIAKNDVEFNDLRTTLAKQVNAIAKQSGEDEEDVPEPPKKNKKKGKYPPDASMGTDDEDSMSKRDIYKGLNPAVVKKLKAADELIEKNAVREWEETVQKNWPDVPMDRAATAASLRVLHATDAKAYKAMEQTLNAAQESLRDSEIFKSFGTTSFDTGEDPLVGEAKAKIEKGLYNDEKFAGMTDEQKLAIAKSELMRENPGKYYSSTADRK